MCSSDLTATVIVAGLVLTELAWSNGDKVVPGEVAIDHSQQVLGQLLASSREIFGSVSLTERNDGVLALTGFIDSEEAYARLAEQVRQQSVSSGGNVRMDVLTPGRLEALVRDTLSRFPLAVRTETTAETIQLNVFGVKLEPEIMARVKSDLSRLAPRVNPKTLKIEFNVQEADKILRDITQSLSKSPATRDLRVELDESGGHIVGNRHDGTGPTHHGTHACHEFAHAIWLGDVIVGTHLEPHDGVDLGTLRGDHDDGHLSALPELTTHVDAAHLRQHHVEQHDVGAHEVELAECFHTIGGHFHPETLTSEADSECLHVTGFVFNDQHGGTGTSGHQQPSKGIERENTLPSPSRERTLTVPPWLVAT